MFLQYQHTRMRFKQKRFVSRDNGRPGTRRKLLLLFRHTGGITRPSALRYSAFCHSRHPPENAPAFPAYRRHYQITSTSFCGILPFRHPPKNAPAFPAYPPSMAVKKAGLDYSGPAKLERLEHHRTGPHRSVSHILVLPEW
jgi:hypothetical protein